MTNEEKIYGKKLIDYFKFLFINKPLDKYDPKIIVTKLILSIICAPISLFYIVIYMNICEINIYNFNFANINYSIILKLLKPSLAYFPLEFVCIYLGWLYFQIKSWTQNYKSYIDGDSIGETHLYRLIIIFFRNYCVMLAVAYVLMVILFPILPIGKGLSENIYLYPLILCSAGYRFERFLSYFKSLIAKGSK